MSASTIPVVKAQLKTLFEAAVQPTTAVWRNRPTEQHDAEENVYVGDVRGNREWRNVGGGQPYQREESYSIRVDVEVYRDGTDAEGTELRMWEIVNQLEAAITADVKLGVTADVQWSLVNRFEQKATGASSGWLTSCALDVAVAARI